MPSLVRKAWFPWMFGGATGSFSVILFFLITWPAISPILQQVICVLIALVVVSVPIIAYEIVASKQRARRGIKS